MVRRLRPSYKVRNITATTTFPLCPILRFHSLGPGGLWLCKSLRLPCAQYCGDAHVSDSFAPLGGLGVSCFDHDREAELSFLL